MSWIFIRHDPKKYNNGKGIPIFDPDLLETQSRLNSDILSNWKPEVIISSPFRRCRSTCKRYYPDINPIINNDLSEYLGHWNEFKKFHFVNETWKHISKFNFHESIDELKSRVIRIESELIVGKDTLIVSHGLCLQFLGDHFSKKGFFVNYITSDPKMGFKIDNINKII